MNNTLTIYRALFLGAVLLLFGSSPVHAQTSFAILSAPAAEGELELVRSGEKWQRINAIFQDLVAAKSDFRLPPPRLVLAKNVREKIAFLSEDGRTIGIEEAALEVLDRYGDDGYAFILGHEVTHFYERHQYSISTRGKYQDYLVDSLISQLSGTLEKAEVPPTDSLRAAVAREEQRLRAAVAQGEQRLLTYAAETESDYLGGFLAYSAGYDVSSSPQLLRDLYEAYHLDTVRMFGYAPMRQRLAENEAAHGRMNELIDVFDAANLMTAAGRYNNARFLYRYILEDYQSREVYNNLGVLTLLTALDLFSPTEMPYRLPLELDLTIRKGARGGDDATRRKALLAEAARYFRNAVRLDENYATAYLNLACTHYLQRDTTRARYFAATEARQRALANPETFPQTAQRADVLLALLAPDDDAVTAALLPLRERSTVARYNLAQRSAAHPLNEHADPDELRLDWSIGKLRHDALPGARGRTRTGGSVAYALPDATELRKWDKSAAGYTLYRFTVPGSKDDYFSFAISRPDTDMVADEEEGFRVGTPFRDIDAVYAQPLREIPYAGGWLYIYDHNILQIDADGKLRRWAVY